MTLTIRPARPEDGAELQALQARCPMGEGLVLRGVNEPDFFARAKAYSSYRVLCAELSGRLVGSCACAPKAGTVAGATARVGYQFQYFVDPEARRAGIAAKLLAEADRHLEEQGCAFSYAYVLDGNHAMRSRLEKSGYRALCAVSVYYVSAIRVRPVPQGIRPLRESDLDAAAKLLNRSWEGHDLFEVQSGAKLAERLSRTPGHGLEQVLVLERDGELRALLGYWRLDAVTSFSVIAQDRKLRLLSHAFDLGRLILPLPRVPRPGEKLHQWCLTPLAFTEVDDLAALVRAAANRAFAERVDLLALLAAPGSPAVRALRGLLRVGIGHQMFGRALCGAPLPSLDRLYVDGADL